MYLPQFGLPSHGEKTSMFSSVFLTLLWIFNLALGLGLIGVIIWAIITLTIHFTK